MPPGTRDQHTALPAAWRDYRPIVARSKTVHAPIAPVAYDCVKLIFVRHGSAILLSEFGERPVTIGDVVTLIGEVGVEGSSDDLGRA